MPNPPFPGNFGRRSSGRFLYDKPLGDLLSLLISSVRRKTAKDLGATPRLENLGRNAFRIFLTPKAKVLPLRPKGKLVKVLESFLLEIVHRYRSFDLK